jgi:hypothetical protein
MDDGESGEIVSARFFNRIIEEILIEFDLHPIITTNFSTINKNGNFTHLISKNTEVHLSIKTGTQMNYRPQILNAIIYKTLFTDKKYIIKSASDILEDFKKIINIGTEKIEAKLMTSINKIFDEGILLNGRYSVDISHCKMSCDTDLLLVDQKGEEVFTASISFEIKGVFDDFDS